MTTLGLSLKSLQLFLLIYYFLVCTLHISSLESCSEMV